VTETESTRILHASLALSASLLEAPDDESVLHVAMRAGCDAPRVDESREWFLSDTTINRDEFLNRFMEGESPMQVVLVSLGSTESVVLYQRKRLTAEQAESWLVNPWG
jgi:hypothetical protein